MAMSRSKVVVVGAGAVGAAVAFDLVINQICDDLVLIDINREKAWAEATDLQHSLGYSGSRMRIKDGDFDECADADLVVISAALPYIKGQNRPDQLGKASVLIRSIVPAIMASGFSGILIVITNPVDVMTYLAYKLSGLPANQVIGTGTALDSARLKNHIAGVMDVDPNSVHAICLGEHGDSQMIPWSLISVGGKRFQQIVHDNLDRLHMVDMDQVVGQISQVAFRIMQAKGATTFGIAATTVQIIKAILRDENKVIPVSAMLNGEYGESDVYAGVPAVLCNQGIKELVEYHLDPTEREQLRHSIATIRAYNSQLEI